MKRKKKIMVRMLMMMLMLLAVFRNIFMGLSDYTQNHIRI